MHADSRGLAAVCAPWRARNSGGGGVGTGLPPDGPAAGISPRFYILSRQERGTILERNASETDERAAGPPRPLRDVMSRAAGPFRVKRNGPVGSSGAIANVH